MNLPSNLFSSYSSPHFSYLVDSTLDLPPNSSYSPNSSINSGSAPETNARAVSIPPIIASHMNCWPGIWILIPTSYSYRIVSYRTCRRAVRGSSSTHHVCYDTSVTISILDHNGVRSHMRRAAMCAIFNSPSQSALCTTSIYVCGDCAILVRCRAVHGVGNERNHAVSLAGTGIIAVVDRES